MLLNERARRVAGRFLSRVQLTLIAWSVHNTVYIDGCDVLPAQDDLQQKSFNAKDPLSIPAARNSLHPLRLTSYPLLCPNYRDP